MGKIFGFLMLFGAIFYFFLDGAEDIAEDTSVRDIFYMDSRTIDARKHHLDALDDFLDKIGAEIEKRFSIDIEESILDVIKEKKFKNLEIKTGQQGAAVVYQYSFLNSNGKKTAITMYIIDKSLAGANSAILVSIEYSGEKISRWPAVNIAHYVYGLDPKLCLDFERLYPNYRNN